MSLLSLSLSLIHFLTPFPPPHCLQERKYVEQHQGALHKPLPTALMNKAFKHFQQDQSENSVGCALRPRGWTAVLDVTGCMVA